jgi:serine/threonine-protein kinase HipA
MNCLLCYKRLTPSEKDYHAKCVMKIFWLKQLPIIDIDEKKMVVYAKKIVGTHTAITGVQPKLSLWLEENKQNIRFTVVDNKSNYIIKPQSETYNSLPENEDLCMHLAQTFGLNTATHGLVRMPSGSLAYITKRFDREGNNKLACEDLCQLTETLTEHKYRSSYEKAGKAIKQFSSRAGLDALNYFKLVVFSFISANADMHLKNFSMLENKDGYFSLSPTYDLVSTFLVIKNEIEQMCLTINGKKNRLSKKDFNVLAKNLSLSEKQRQNCYQLFLNKMNEAIWWIENSFLPDNHKKKLQHVLITRIKLLNS